MQTELQETSTGTNRPSSSILSDTDSTQIYESMDGSADEIYTFVTAPTTPAPTTPAEQPGQQHQNPLPLLTDVSSRLRAIQTRLSPPQSEYSYCDVQTSDITHKPTNKPSQSRPPQNEMIADMSSSRHTGVSQQALYNKNCKGQNTVCSSLGNTIFVTIPSHGIALKFSSGKK